MKNPEQTLGRYIARLATLMSDGYVATAAYLAEPRTRSLLDITRDLQDPIEHVRLLFLASEDELLSSREHRLMLSVRRSSAYLMVAGEMSAYGISPERWAENAAFFVRAIESDLDLLDQDEVERIEDVFYFVWYSCTDYLDYQIETSLVPDFST